MLRILSSQFNYQYGDQMHFPYSIARLVAFVRADEQIRKNVQFQKTFMFRERLSGYLDTLSQADILLCSCYVWNWEITKRLAAEVKKKFPNCLVIFGGPQVPDNDSDFFASHPYVDVLVHGEGEVTVLELLRAQLKQVSIQDIQGISTRQGKTPERERLRNLALLPSPYLSDVVWDLVDREAGIQWIASWETNRGCPYKCTFCDWGSATFAKMHQFPDEVLHQEVQWFADNKIGYIDCCDSNFGIFPRDLELATQMKEQALSKKYPKVFRQSWAKNSSTKIIPIAKELQAAGLLSAVGLAVESLDKATLETIKRKNIRFEKFSDLTTTFAREKIPTYTEIIRGLPGETLESFKAGLELLLCDSRIGAIYIYNCTVLPNAELNAPQYRQEHAIESFQSPVYLAHSKVAERGVEEYEQIVCASATFSVQDVKQMYLYSWFVLTFHSLGILQQVADFCHRWIEIPYMELFGYLESFCQNSKGLFAKEYSIVRAYIDQGYAGKSWNHYDSSLGDIYWPIEEASWLRLTSNPISLRQEIVEFLTYVSCSCGLQATEDTFEDLANFQVFLLTKKEDVSKIKTEAFSYNWMQFFSTGRDLEKREVRYACDNKMLETDPTLWNYRVVWYGRRKQTFKNAVEELKENGVSNGLEAAVLQRSETIKPPP